MQIGPIQLPSPAVVLAPMEDVSDLPFRIICKRLGADFVTTEFISAEGLIRDAWKSVAKLAIEDEERPMAAQIFGHNPQVMAEAAQYAERSGADVVDINIGCPVKKVVSKLSGAGLLTNCGLMIDNVRAVVEAVKIPVTVKTRLGWDEDSIAIERNAKLFEDVGVRSLAIHARTRAQGYKGTARWEWIGRAKAQVSIPVVGNGDVVTPDDAAELVRTTGCDGVMIGRGAIGNPWIFEQAKHFIATGERLPEPTLAERVAVVLEHLRLSVEIKGERHGVIDMRKHYGQYLKAFPGAGKLRSELMQPLTAQPVVDRLGRLLDDLHSGRLEPEPVPLALVG